MGVASYREDIYFRFLESTEPLADAVIIPARPYEICPFCASSFETQTSLLEHLSQAHRGDRPILLLHGREPDRQFQIGYRLHKESIVVENCTSIHLRANGSPPVQVSLNSLTRLLTEEVDSILDLELENKFERPRGRSDADIECRANHCPMSYGSWSGPRAPDWRVPGKAAPLGTRPSGGMSRCGFSVDP
jgi:hypothetical protein